MSKAVNPFSSLKSWYICVNMSLFAEFPAYVFSAKISAPPEFNPS